jgi:esterase/lipase/1-acyl-sn-glycerol-3-phosphate acyltransferase
MNRFAYQSTGLAIRALTALSKATIHIHGRENIPDGSLIFVANHFTRLETLLLTNYAYQLTDKKPVWSLAAAELYNSSLGAFLDKMGAVSTHNPDRDRLIVKSLLTGEASWIIYPEGRMVKNKKIFDKGQYLITYAGKKQKPHTGAAALALRTEFYRQRLRKMHLTQPAEINRLTELFQIDQIDPVLETNTYLVPVNITYYPLRAKENALNYLADRFLENVSDRMEEELMAEGTILLSSVDIDIRFGKPINVSPFLDQPVIQRDIDDSRKIGFDDVLPSTPTMRQIASDLTNRYMRAIYRLTTVNPEHLFATILKYLPRQRFDPADLKRRVFLTISENYKPADIFFHRNMDRPPLHLLTDDRHHWFDHFITLAIEKGVVKPDGNQLIKIQSKLTTLFDFHRVRVENPIKVMINEIEPMTGLQKHLRAMGRLPRLWIKRRTRRFLLQLGRHEFDQDYQSFYIEGESKPKKVGTPFLLRGRSRKIGIVLIHGYMAAPMEVAELAQYLNRQGWWIYAPRVKGHGTSPEDLSLRSRQDWMESADLGYAIINLLCRKTIVGGFSNGAGLALDLSARIQNITAVFAVCPPFKLHAATARLAPAMDMWNRLVGRVQPKMAKQFVENDPENPDINYGRNPVSGVTELEKLMDQVLEAAPDIDSPVLLILADKDPVVDEKGAKRFFEKLESENKQYMLFHFDRHGIIRGENAQQVHRVIGQFVKSSVADASIVPPHTLKK